MYKRTMKLDSKFVVQLAHICPCLEGLSILVRDIKAGQLHLHPTILIQKAKMSRAQRGENDRRNYVLLVDTGN